MKKAIEVGLVADDCRSTIVKDLRPRPLRGRGLPFGYRCYSPSCGDSGSLAVFLIGGARCRGPQAREAPGPYRKIDTIGFGLLQLDVEREIALECRLGRLSFRYASSRPPTCRGSLPRRSKQMRMVGWAVGGAAVVCCRSCLAITGFQISSPSFLLIQRRSRGHLGGYTSGRGFPPGFFTNRRGGLSGPQRPHVPRPTAPHLHLENRFRPRRTFGRRQALLRSLRLLGPQGPTDVRAGSRALHVTSANVTSLIGGSQKAGSGLAYAVVVLNVVVEARVSASEGRMALHSAGEEGARLPLPIPAARSQTGSLTGSQAAPSGKRRGFP